MSLIVCWRDLECVKITASRGLPIFLWGHKLRFDSCFSSNGIWTELVMSVLYLNVFHSMCFVHFSSVCQEIKNAPSL